MRPSRSCWKGTKSASQPEEITSKGARIACVHIRKKSGNLFNDPRIYTSMYTARTHTHTHTLYIYIYIYTCMCACKWLCVILKRMFMVYLCLSLSLSVSVSLFLPVFLSQSIHIFHRGESVHTIYLSIYLSMCM